MDSRLYIPGIQLIGIHGNAGAGKDTVGNYLANKFHDFYTESFAGDLKLAASHAFGIPQKNFNETALKAQLQEFWGVSPREIAQFVGTELFRDMIPNLVESVGPEFWVFRMAGKLNGKARLPEYDGDYSAGDTVAITDVRFQNEYDWIIKNGGIVIILRRKGADGNVGIANHRSEAGLDAHANERTSIIENNGTLAELYSKVDDVIDNQPFLKLTPKGYLNV